MLNTFDEQREQQIEESTKKWDWEKVFQVWKRRLDGFNIQLAPLFLTVNVHDSANPEGRHPNLTWWKTTSVRSSHMECQRHLDKFPGTRGYMNEFGTEARVGETTTIRYLWENQSDLEIVAAILIAGSVFPYTESSRRYFFNRPFFLFAKTLGNIAYSRWLDSKQHDAWHYSCTNVLPQSYIERDYDLDTMDAMIKGIADEHASILLNYRPVVIEYGTNRDPFIGKALDDEYKAKQQQHEEWLKQDLEMKAANKLQLEAIKLKHPRYGEWDKLSLGELEKLVWTKSTLKLSTEFGVSDVAIGKRCKSHGIAKPPKGYWTKVAAGTIPHPDGKPLSIPPCTIDPRRKQTGFNAQNDKNI